MYNFGIIKITSAFQLQKLSEKLRLLPVLLCFLRKTEIQTRELRQHPVSALFQGLSSCLS